MMKLDIQKHIKFIFTALCFSSNFNHILRSTNPLFNRLLAQKFDELRAKVLSQLLGCKLFQIPDHVYLSPHYGGLGWTKASILTSCACRAGCRNAIFEFCERFANWEDLLMPTQSSTVSALIDDISKIEIEKWSRCFPQSFNGNIQEKNFLNLKYILQTLQKRLTGMYENDLNNNICSSVVLNQGLHSLLLEKGVNLGSDDRGDVYCDWIENSGVVVDFLFCNVANDTLVQRKLNPVSALEFKAKEIHRKYDKDIEEVNADKNRPLVFMTFPFSINRRLSVETKTFLDDFQKMVQEKTMKRFDIFLWRPRVQFTIINRLPRFFNRIREVLARQQADQDFVEEILVP
ncbi:hypothetical protein P9112_004167 [Eukaryota sp. TZLM1-RC]